MDTTGYPWRVYVSQSYLHSWKTQTRIVSLTKQFTYTAIHYISSLSVKYIALMAMVKIVPVHPNLVAEHQAVILASLDDFDISIRMRALELISSMVGLPNLP